MLSREVSALTIRLGGRLQSFPTRMPIAAELVAEILRRVMAHSAIHSKKGNRAEMWKGWVERKREVGRRREESAGEKVYLAGGWNGVV
jgi:hypothetical protein